MRTSRKTVPSTVSTTPTRHTWRTSHLHPVQARARTSAHAPEPSLGSLPNQRNMLLGLGVLLLIKRRHTDGGHPATHTATGLEHISSDHNKQHDNPCTPGPSMEDSRVTTHLTHNG
jgi:hypothetical protein